MPSPAPESHDRNRPEETRRRNERIAGAALLHRFGADAPVPFLCECSDERCVELIRMPLSAYRTARDGGHYLTAAGHQVAGATLVRIRETCWLYRRDHVNGTVIRDGD